MSEYQVKLEAIREYREALKLKKLYAEGIELNSSLLREIVTYCERVGIEIPDRERVFGFMDRLLTIASPKWNSPSNHPDTEQDPKSLMKTYISSERVVIPN